MAAAALAVLLASGAGSATRADYPRRTPIVEAVQKIRPAIVSVRVEKGGGAGPVRETTGTGVVVDERGYIVTNCHIAAGGHRYVIRFADQTERDARVIALDEGHDLAILRVEAGRALAALEVGPAGDLMVGETVIAVGHPYGYANSVSTGIVSALGREVTMPSGAVLANLIQTDASINPGNSGGPLVNINGELIGINVAFREGAHGIAFAINADTLRDVLSRHLSGRNVAGIRHGITCSERLRAEGAPRQRVVVAAVAAQTPAEAAGIRQGDEILQVAGRAVANRFDVERALWDHRPDERILLRVVRAGKEITVPLQLAAGTVSDPAVTRAASKSTEAAPESATPAARR
jgi:serine protease Do